MGLKKQIALAAAAAVGAAVVGAYAYVRRTIKKASTDERSRALHRQSAPANFTGVAASRSSWRTYDPSHPLTSAERADLSAYLADDRRMTGPFGLRAQVVLVDGAEFTGKLGTYGFIKGATTFFVAKWTDRGVATDLYDLGYVLENLVLHCTQMRLGTVWLGGTFTAKSFSEAARCGPNESVRMVIPVGHVPDERRAMDAIMHYMHMGSRKPLATMSYRARPDGTLEPLTAETAGRWASAIECVRWAPSAMNGQPWAVVQYGESPAVFSFFKIALSKHAEQKHWPENDVGIAMSHLEGALAEMGIHGRWSLDKLSGAVPPIEGASFATTFKEC